MSSGTDPEGIIGQTLGNRYQVIDFVARGAGGSIYRGKQLGLDRLVAIKTLYAGHAEREDLRVRFEREAALCARLTDPNTVRVFDYGASNDGNVLYIIMEFLDGRNLYDVIKEEAPLSPKRVTHIMRQICGALSEAHDQGIVHRDMKPGNVLLVESRGDKDFVKVVDFGLVKQLDSEAQLTTPGQVLGTPSYMSPEQIRGETDIDARADIYALGSMMYVMLTRKRHLPGKDLRTMIQAHVMHDVKPFSAAFPELNIPPELEEITLKALQRDREKRFQSCRELGDALFELEEQWSTGVLPSIGSIPVSTGTTAQYPVAPRQRSNAWWLAIGVLAALFVLSGVVALLGGGAAFLLTRTDPDPVRHQAPQLGEVMPLHEIPEDHPEEPAEEPEAETKDAPKPKDKREEPTEPVPQTMKRPASPVQLGWDLVASDPAAAEAKFIEGIRSNPSADGYYGLGYARLKKGDKSGAREPLCRSLTMSPKRETRREVEGLLNANEISCD